MKQTNKSKAVLIISLSPLNRDPRVIRQANLINSFRPDLELVTIGLGANFSLASSHFELTKEPHPTPGNYLSHTSGSMMFLAKLLIFFRRMSGLIGMHHSFFWSIGRVKQAQHLIREIQQRYQVEMVVANDFDCMPLVAANFEKDKVFLDSHEYTPDQSISRTLSGNFTKRHKAWLVRNNYFYPKHMSTVSIGIRNQYLERFGKREIVIWENVPLAEKFSHEASGSKSRLVHHGLGTRPRQIERLIETLNALGNSYELHLYLVNLSEVYRQELTRTHKSGELFFHDPVRTEHISKELSQYDIGLFLHAPKSLNAKYMLPNKFFEFANAGLAVATGPAKEMSSISLERGFGIVSKDFDPANMAQEILKLDAGQIAKKKLAAKRFSMEFDGIYVNKTFVDFLLDD